MNADLAALLYLVSGVLFILALRGLSSPETSRQGNNFGMLGMAIAIVTTLLLVDLDTTTMLIIGGAILIGGAVGAIIARSIKMTEMPQLVAAFHSLVGLAAVAVAAAAFYAPESFGIAEGEFIDLVTGRPHIHLQSLIELSLGTAIGAITFTGSVIAFAKLNGNMSGAPIMLPARHLINIAIALAIVASLF
jgi:NAD(P) transhydrogenase subunit beta